MDKQSKNLKNNDIFNKLAQQWWQENGNFHILHKLNPIRIQYIIDNINLYLPARKFSHLKILDIGCGGGLVAEALARKGAKVYALDSDPKTIDIATKHSQNKELNIHYKIADFNDFVIKEKFHVILALEVIEHNLKPREFIRKAANLLAKNALLFVSTINRNLKSFVFAKIAAEYVFNIIPKNTHQWHQFITPQELSSYMPRNLEKKSTQGLVFNPIKRTFHISDNTRINYIMTWQNLNYDLI